MKRLLSTFAIICAVLLGLNSCDSKSNATAPSVKKDIDATIDYAMGNTAVKVKNKVTKDLQKINQQHNKDLEKNLE